MKKIENITITRMNGEPMLHQGRPLKLVDMAVMALEQGQGLGFKVFVAGQKLARMQSVDAPDLLLEDAEAEGVLRAIKAGKFFDFVMDQAEAAFTAAKEYKIE